MSPVTERRPRRFWRRRSSKKAFARCCRCKPDGFETRHRQSGRKSYRRNSHVRISRFRAIQSRRSANVFRQTATRKSAASLAQRDGKSRQRRSDYGRRIENDGHDSGCRRRNAVLTEVICRRISLPTRKEWKPFWKIRIS